MSRRLRRKHENAHVERIRLPPVDQVPGLSDVAAAWRVAEIAHPHAEEFRATVCNERGEAIATAVLHSFEAFADFAGRMTGLGYVPRRLEANGTSPCYDFAFEHSLRMKMLMRLR